MSKSSSNDDINIAYLDKLTEAVVDMTVKLDKISSSYGSNGQLEQTIRKLAQEVNNGSMSLKQMLKEASATQKNIRSVEYGLEDTTKYNKTVNMFLKLLEERMGDSKIDEVLVEKITTAFENLDVSAILESEKIEQRGGKGAPLKNTLDNEKLGRVNEDLARRIGLSLDTTTDKLITFFQEQEKKKEKKERGFVDDLIEGLEKSKWVGGALQDTFRLIGLLGANWLSKFGQLGRILGGAFYVAMSTAGPLLVKLLLQGIGKLFTSLPRMLGSLGKGLWGGAVRLSTNMGGPLSMFTPGRWGMMSGAGKAASVGRLAGAGAAAGAFGTGAFFAGRESYRSFKQGDKVGGSAFGVGAAGLGVAAIAAIVAGVAAPVTLIAAAVGGIAVGIGAIWKSREKIVNFLSEHKGILDKILKFLGILFPGFKLVEKLLDHIVNKDSKDGDDSVSSATVKVGPFNIGGKGEHAQLLKGITDKKGHIIASKVDWAQADKEEAVYGSIGQILNLGKMTQRRAAELIRADIDQKGSKSYYERFKRTDKRIEGKSFATDAADADYVYFVRGTMERFEKNREIARKLGLKGVESQQISSGLGTLGSRERVSPHKYVDSPDLHFGTTSTIDVSPLYWSDGKKFKGYGKYMGVPYEFHHNDGSDQHAHLAFYQFKGMEEKAKAQEKATAKQHSLAIKNVAEFVDSAAVKQARTEKALRSSTGTNTELTDADYMAILKKKGIYEDKNTNTWMRNTDKGVESLWYDSAGNMQWRLIVSTMQGASQGSAGR